MKCCCFTGPRIYKLQFKQGEQDPLCDALKQKIKKEILSAIEEGFSVFLSGMAIGIDIFCAEIILELKKVFPHIKLNAVIPFEQQADRWNENDIVRYRHILSKADQVITLQKEYTRDCFFKRNQYMVDLSSLVIAVYGGGNGGTKHTLNYATKNGVRIKLIPL